MYVEVVVNTLNQKIQSILNIVIEWDEKYHNKSKQKRKDKIREKEIIKFLKCDFYRVDESSGKIRLVNNE